MNKRAFLEGYMNNRNHPLAKQGGQDEVEIPAIIKRMVDNPRLAMGVLGALTGAAIGAPIGALSRPEGRLGGAGRGALYGGVGGGALGAGTTHLGLRTLKKKVKEATEQAAEQVERDLFGPMAKPRE